VRRRSTSDLSACWTGEDLRCLHREKTWRSSGSSSRVFVISASGASRRCHSPSNLSRTRSGTCPPEYGTGTRRDTPLRLSIISFCFLFCFILPPRSTRVTLDYLLLTGRPGQRVAPRSRPTARRNLLWHDPSRARIMPKRPYSQVVRAIDLATSEAPRIRGPPLARRKDRVPSATAKRKRSIDHASARSASTTRTHDANWRIPPVPRTDDRAAPAAWRRARCSNQAPRGPELGKPATGRTGALSSQSPASAHNHRFRGGPRLYRPHRSRFSWCRQNLHLLSELTLRARTSVRNMTALPPGDGSAAGPSLRRNALHSLSRGLHEKKKKRPPPMGSSHRLAVPGAKVVYARLLRISRRPPQEHPRIRSGFQHVGFTGCPRLAIGNAPARLADEEISPLGGDPTRRRTLVVCSVLSGKTGTFEAAHPPPSEG